MPRLSKIGAAALAAFGWTSGASVTASYLVVAGGGGSSFGGGGAGGLQSGTTSLDLTLSYTVVVGAGGAFNSVSPYQGFNGSNSTFGTLTASVGGGGGSALPGNGVAGGSGGGGTGSGTSGGAGTAGQGNSGGAGTAATFNAGGGGGGSGGVGGNSSGGTTGGNAGIGTASSISGTSVTYAGGGSGASTSGGGQGSTTAGGGSTANLGGGGNCTGATLGNGGSGIVIISYPAPQQFGGGVVTASGGNIIHTFTTSGTLSPLSSLSASYLIVAGGGGGSFGGAGAGGLLSGSSLIIDTNSNYLVTVGSGGAGQDSLNTTGTNGSNSAFSMVSTAAVGGGGGGKATGTLTGNSGGSGGGGGNNGAGGAGTSGQGNAGGNGYTDSASYGLGGGGGGASAVGQSLNSGSSTGGNGGAGSASSISGASTTYAGGGGGGGHTVGSRAGGTGGSGGGGNGSMTGNASSGTNGLGGGGGGAGSATGTGGNGGSGVVIISYPGSTQQMAGGTVTISGGNVIHTFTSSGYLTPLTLVGNSLRFRSSASAYLNRTPASAGNRQIWTWSGWVKRGSLSTNQNIFGARGSSPNEDDSFLVQFSGGGYGTANDVLIVSYGNAAWKVTTQVFRDPSAWYHIVVAFDSTQTTGSNRIKLYVNGSQVTSFSTDTAPTLNLNSAINKTIEHRISSYASAAPQYLDGYQTEINFVDGQALTPNSFGTFNGLGVWQPIRYGGSYGTNGFYLPFNAGTSTFAGSFNGSNQYLDVAQDAAFNFGTGDFTVETWVYANSWGTTTPIIALGDGARGGGTPLYSGWAIRYDTSNGLGFYRFDGTETYVYSSTTIPIGSWNHIAVSRSSGTLKMFVNGSQVYSAANTTSYNNVNSNTLKIGGNWFAPTVTWFNGLLSNTRIVKGTGLYTANFTLPTQNLTAVSGTSLLTLQGSTIVDNSTNAFTINNYNSVTTGQTYPFSAARIFNDQSPQGNNWTPNNISGVFGSTLDYMTDVPTLTSATAANYCVVNPLWTSGTATSPTLTGGNLNVASNGGATFRRWAGTVGIDSGKYYFEFTRTDAVGAGNYFGFGVTNANSALSTDTYGGNPTSSGATSVEWALTDRGTACNTSTYTDLSGTIGSVGQNDVIQVCIDMDSKKIWFGKNNTFSGSPSAGTGQAFSNLPSLIAPIVYVNGATTSVTASVNFGQRPFAYTPPSGFLPLNTFNL